jgi:DNA-binding NarL/FixJ family response regulator
MACLSILLLGNTDRTEFHGARLRLEAWGTVDAFAEVAAALAALAAGQIVPDVIVVVQAFPGQFSHSVLDRLRRLAPLARVIGLLGSWCEGEMRTGSPWPGAVRTYWHQWAIRCDRQLCRLAKGESCAWALPPTATEEERLLADMGEAWPQRQGMVVIWAQSREMAEWLSAACRSRGLATVWQRPPITARVEGAVAAIFDGGDLGEDQSHDLERLVAALHPAPVLTLLDFPRVSDRAHAFSVGAAAVVSKPVAVDDLLWELERIGKGEAREKKGARE